MAHGVCLLLRIVRYGATLMVVAACNAPARGPESKSAVIVTGPGGCDEGTRTEARQNVPQENPEWAVAMAWPSVLISASRAPKSSCVAGETGAPQ
jgi:hypothetical protein